MKKAFAYLRVSGRGQLEGDGFERQLLAIKKYAAANDIRIVKIFREEGVSGKTDLENRPALQQLMTDLHRNGTKLVLVEKLDRLARFLQVQESILTDLRRRGFELCSVTEPDLNSDDPTRVLMRQVLGAFFEYERSMIVAKLKGARERVRAKEGRCEGRKPYGEREGEQEVIERIKGLKSNGLPLSAIASTLNAGDIPSRAGKWHPTSISRVLAAN